MFARSRFQIGPSKQLQNNRCLALRRPPSCARQRRRFRRLLSRPPGSLRSPGIGSLCVGHAFLLQNIFSTNVPNELSNEIPGRERSLVLAPASLCFRIPMMLFAKPAVLYSLSSFRDFPRFGKPQFRVVQFSRATSQGLSLARPSLVPF